MGRQPLRAGRRIDGKTMRAEAASLFAELGVRMDPARICRGLSIADQQVVEIAKALSLNRLLCQLTADACGLPVVAGPAEATAIGNILVQARVLGAAPDDLDGMRALVRATQPLSHFEPTGDAGSWAAAAERLAH